MSKSLDRATRIREDVAPTFGVGNIASGNRNDRDALNIRPARRIRVMVGNESRARQYDVVSVPITDGVLYRSEIRGPSIEIYLSNDKKKTVYL